MDAREILRQRYHEQLIAAGVGGTSSSLPPRPSSTSSSAALHSSSIVSRPNTAPSNNHNSGTVGTRGPTGLSSLPSTRPASRSTEGYGGLDTTPVETTGKGGGLSDFSVVRDTLLREVRGGLSLTRPSTADAASPSSKWSPAAKAKLQEQLHSSINRPPPTALSVLALHQQGVRDAAAAAEGGGRSTSYFERAKFRNLLKQLEKNNKDEYVQKAWSDTALATLDTMLSSQEGAVITEQLRNVRQSIDTSTLREVGGDGLSVLEEPEARLQFVVQQIRQALAPHPALQSFTNLIVNEYDLYVSSLKRQSHASEANIAKTALKSTVEELADAKRQLLISEKRVQELTQLTESLATSNHTLQENQQKLEEYVDDLRVALATFANTNLQGGGDGIRPDTAGKGGFVQAIQRLAKEVDSLRKENIRLCEEGSHTMRDNERVSEEMTVLLEKANQYQQQVAQLKGSIRSMKSYMEMLESSVRDLRSVHEENELLRATVPMQVAKFERDFIIPYEYNIGLVLRQLLQQKGLTFLTPHEYAETGGPLVDEKLVNAVQNRMPNRIGVSQFFSELDEDEDFDGDGDHGGTESHGDGAPTQTPASGRSLAASSVAPSEFMAPTINLPIHLMSRFSTIKLKPMSCTDVRAMITDIFTDYGAAVQARLTKDPRAVPHHFDQYCKDWTHKKLRHEKITFEQTLSLFYWAEKFKYRAPEMILFYKASVGFVGGNILQVVTESLNALKVKLQSIEPTTKKQKDRITRDAFVDAIKVVFPQVTLMQLEALMATVLLSQDGRVFEEVSYESFFDRSGQAAMVYDALARLALAHAESLYLQLEETVYLKHHEANLVRFDKLRASREECGSSGSVAAKPMTVEPIHQDHCARIRLKLFADCIREFDPHCSDRQLWLRLSVAAGKADLNRLTNKEAEEEALGQFHDVGLLMKNLRKGISWRLSPPPPPEDKQRVAEDKQNRAGEGRSSRPPSASFV